jgi:hypothetical protein
MKNIKVIYKCTDCSSGPCFCIQSLDSIPQHCIPVGRAAIADNKGPEDKGEAYTETVNWLPKETLYHDKGFSPEILKEILDA